MHEVGKLQVRLNPQEAAILRSLVSQLLALLQSHSSIALDPDPLLASYEIGGTDCLPEDPALARLLPNAYLDPELASEFRKVTEQGLINRKLEDALLVSTMMGPDGPDQDDVIIQEDTLVTITEDTLQPWVRTLTALRISIAARIGIESEDDHERLHDDTEHKNTFMIYEWLAALTDMLLRFTPALEDDEEEI